MQHHSSCSYQENVRDICSCGALSKEQEEKDKNKILHRLESKIGSQNKDIENLRKRIADLEFRLSNTRVEERDNFGGLKDF